MPSSGTGVTKEHHKEKRESNKKSSRRNSKVMDLNKVHIVFYELYFKHYDTNFFALKTDIHNEMLISIF